LPEYAFRDPGGTLNKEPLLIRIHSLLTIWAPELPREVREAIAGQLGMFVSQDKGEPTAHDILVEAVDSLPVEAPIDERTSILFGISLTNVEGRQAFTFSFRGRPEIALVISDTPKILFIPRKGVARKLFGVLLFCVNHLLMRRGAALFHGAAAEKDGRCVVMTGPRGSRKTMLLLSLLRDGWDYLSDDKFILSGKQAFIFQDFVNVRGHHLRALPWLAGSVGSVPFLLGSPSLTNMVERFIQKRVGRQFRPAVDRIFNPSVRVDVGENFGSRKVMSATPSDVFIMRSGPRFALETLERDEAVEDLEIVQDLLFHEFIVVGRMLSLYDGRIRRDRISLIDSNLAEDTRFHRLTVPYGCGAEELYREFDRCLRQAS